MIEESERKRLFAELHSHLREVCRLGDVEADPVDKCCLYSVAVNGADGNCIATALIGPLEIEHESKDLRRFARRITDKWMPSERVVRKPYRWPKCLRPEIVAIAYDPDFGGSWWGYKSEPYTGESCWECLNFVNMYDLSALDPSLLPQIDPANWKNSLHLKSECEVEP